MTTLENALLIVALIAFTGTALCALYRVVVGPTILDRMIASDVLLTTIILVAGVDMVLRDHTDSIPLMTVLAATAVFATIAVARYVSRHAKTSEQPPAFAWANTEAAASGGAETGADTGILSTDAVDAAQQAQGNGVPEEDAAAPEAEEGTRNA